MRSCRVEKCTLHHAAPPSNFERGVAKLVMVGLATDFCVRFSAVDAAKLGFGVTVLEDACRAIDLDGSLAAARAAMAEHGVAVSASGR